MMNNKSNLIFFLILLISVNAFSDDFFTTWIPMRDGEFLAADVYSPDTTQVFPVILIKTPYNKDWYQENGLPLQTEDYAFCIVDWRGFHGSSGANTDSVKYGEDGYDCVEWIAEQSWSNGVIGMWGISAVGQVQYQTAREHPPHLVCCVPIFAESKQYYQRYYLGGVLRKSYIETLELLGYDIDVFLEHPIYDNFWILIEYLTYYPQEIDVPMLLMAGSYDHHSHEYAIFEFFNDLHTIGGINGREHHKLIIGPWHHCHLGEEIQGQLSYPLAAGVPETNALNFFDYWLRGIPNGYDDLPTVRYYQMGTDEWIDADAWPLDDITPTSFYLHSDNVLSTEIPSNTCLPDSFYYDPRDPSPTIGGEPISYFLLHGPYDQRWLVENRDDAVLFTTAPLENNLTVDGAISAELYVSSDCLDTDFTVRLCDVYPDGRSMLVMDGIRRMRFRNSFAQEELMIPGEIYPVTIEIAHTALTFLQGHKIRICISSSNYPRFHLNLNNGGEMYVPGDTLIALNKIYHDEEHPSKLILPVRNTTGIDEEIVMENSQNIQIWNYPNPFNPTTTISFSVTQNSDFVTLEIYNIKGQKVKIFDCINCVDAKAMESLHHIIWNGTDENNQPVSSGIYFYRLKAGNDFSETKRMLLLK
ncbi:MAG TPA: CocE/NonD family hydrolase [Candidatus Cloacimonetes bacterium]|nr:CocE/NonD family hydrolase [Candidatus Cloacimonadota bacterium]HEX38287.1 CocE/NonD family hydrolase [Candidatus Cloacimonadota bacterium]